MASETETNIEILGLRLTKIAKMLKDVTQKVSPYILKLRKMLVK
jgi:hypothetical protein